MSQPDAGFLDLVARLARLPGIMKEPAAPAVDPCLCMACKQQSGDVDKEGLRFVNSLKVWAKDHIAYS